MRIRFRDFLAVVFVLIYAGIQWSALHNPGGQDDVISARIQDIMVVIIGFYFVASSKEGKK